MIAVDSCIIIHLFNETQLTPIAQQVLKKDSNWIMPMIWQEEYANVLSKLARKEKRPFEEVINHFDNTVNKLVNAQKHVENRSALQISLEYKITVYDAHFIHIAKEFNVLLVTEDIEIIKKCPKIAMDMGTFLEYSK